MGVVATIVDGDVCCVLGMAAAVGLRLVGQAQPADYRTVTGNPEQGGIVR